MDQPKANNAQRFAAFARGDLGRWQFAVGQRIVHEFLGAATIQTIAERDATSVYIGVLFDDPDEGEATFGTDKIGSFIDMTLPTNFSIDATVEADALQKERAFHQARAVAKREKEREEAERCAREERARLQAEAAKQRARELEAEREFAALKDRYHVYAPHLSSPTSPLFRILLQLDSGEPLGPAEVQWLSDERLHGPLGTHYEQRYLLTRDLWDVVHACAQWRRVSGGATVALQLTDRVLREAYLDSMDVRLAAALLTTRGGAFRDQGNLADAESSAWQALRRNPRSHHPYNLLGAVYFQRGNGHEGLAFFAKAEELGARPHQQEQEMRGALNRAQGDEQRSVAEYLLRRDPVRFAWAKFYLRDTR